MPLSDCETQPSSTIFSSSLSASTSTPAAPSVVSAGAHSGHTSPGSLTVAAAAAAAEDEEKVKKEKRDKTSAFAEGRAAEIEVQKDCLQFDIDCRREEGKRKRPYWSKIRRDSRGKSDGSRRRILPRIKTEKLNSFCR